MEYLVGCNYWGSKWATDMWKYWDRESVENDLKELKKYGVNYLRVFPNWRDFQPLEPCLGWGGLFKEIRLHGEEKMTDEFGLDKDCLQHFSDFCDMAEKYDIKLVVAILTGWMSGATFIPPILYGKNLIIDSEALMWESKFARGFVRAFKDRKCIVAWDLGNEGNNLGRAQTRADAYMWTANLRNSIKAEDNTREIQSSMHALEASLAPGDSLYSWRLQDQGELCDVVSVHPYPSKSIDAHLDPMTGLKASMMPTAQMDFYSQFTHRPCLIQEQGGFGDMMGNQETTASWLRVNLRSTWANGSKGYLWWCAYEQAHLNNPPYSWCMMERELGLLKLDYSPKLVAKEMRKFRELIDNLPIKYLPEKKVDAVIMYSEKEEWWKECSTAYMLAKEAGLCPRFAKVSEPLPESSLYILPCISGWACYPKERYDELLEKVSNGATVYISSAGGILTQSEEVLGLTSFGRRANDEIKALELDGVSVTLNVGEFEYLMKPLTANVLSYDQNENVLFSVNNYGKGKVFYLASPVENYINKPRTMPYPDKYPYYKIYQRVGADVLAKKEIVSQTPEIGITIHPETDNQALVVAVNYAAESKACKFKMHQAWRIADVLYGNTETLTNGEMVVFRIKKA